MVPHAAALQLAPPTTFQVTAVLAVPVTAAENCCALPNATVALLGVTVIATGPAELVGSEGFLVGLVKPAHPARERLPSRNARRSPNAS